MKGLLIKDCYCLKRTVRLLIPVSLGTLFLAVLFTLSARYGNVAHAIAATKEEALREGLFTEAEFYYAYRYVIWCVLFIPMAFTANVPDCFCEDHRSGFSKMLFSLPVTPARIAGARYLSCLLYTLIGTVSSAAAAACVSRASDRLSCAELLSVVFTFSGVMTLFLAVVMPLIYLLGAEKKDLIMISAAVAAVAAVFVCIRGAMPAPSGLPQEQDALFLLTFALGRINRFLTSKGLPLFLAAMLFLAASCLSCVLIIRRRREKAV